MPLNSKRQYYLDVARVVAIFSIVLNHAVNRSFAIRGDQMAEFQAFPIILNLFKTVCAIFSNLGVPLFLMITGVLILGKPMETADDVKGFYKRNLLPLFITTEIWLVMIYWFKVLFYKDFRVILAEGIVPALWGMVKTMLCLDQITFASMWYMPMILCLYATLPFLAIVVQKIAGKGSGWFLLLPAITVFLYRMVLPAANALLAMNGMTPMTTVIREADLLSHYYLYVIAGYLVGAGCLAGLHTASVSILAALTFVLSCAYQFYAFSQPMDYVVSYTFPLLPVCGAFLLELIRRTAHRLKRAEKPITYLSRISFAVYLMHMVVMTTVRTVMDLSGWDPILKMLFLQFACIAASIVIIVPLSRVKLFRKYLFLIK